MLSSLPLRCGSHKKVQLMEELEKKKKCNNCSQNWFRKLTKTPDYWTLLQIYWNYWNLQFIQVHTDSETPYYIYAAALPMADSVNEFNEMWHQLYFI